MNKVIILGSSYAVPTQNHENTHLAVIGEKTSILVDCAGSPIVRLPQAGVELNSLTDLVLTHFHPDHVSGVPLLLMNMWLLGRRSRLNIYGLHHTLERIEDLMGFYDWSSWPDFFPVAFYRLPHQEMTPLLENDDLRVFASPVKHLIPTIGLRVEFLKSGKTMAYSCDTEPCPQVVELARGVDVLIHEATGVKTGHSSAEQAGEIGREAGARSLYLIHYPTLNFEPSSLIEKAATTFGGVVDLARDFMEISFS